MMTSRSPKLLAWAIAAIPLALAGAGLAFAQPGSGPKKPAVSVMTRPAPAVPGLDAEVVVKRATYALDPAVEDADYLRRLDALYHPDVDKAGVFPPHEPHEDLLRSAAEFMAREGRPPEAEDLDQEIVERIMRYDLDRQPRVEAAAKKRAAVFGKDIWPRIPDPPKVDLALRVTNTSEEPIRIQISGDLTFWRMNLEGPGAMATFGYGDGKEYFRIGRSVVLAPGKHVDLPIERLVYGDRGKEYGAYWTKPGTYQLRVGFDTVIKRGKRAANPTHEDRGTPVKLVAPAVTLKVSG